MNPGYRPHDASLGTAVGIGPLHIKPFSKLRIDSVEEYKRRQPPPGEQQQGECQSGRLPSSGFDDSRAVERLPSSGFKDSRAVGRLPSSGFDDIRAVELPRQAPFSKMRIDSVEEYKRRQPPTGEQQQGEYQSGRLPSSGFDDSRAVGRLSSSGFNDSRAVELPLQTPFSKMRIDSVEENKRRKAATQTATPEQEEVDLYHQHDYNAPVLDLFGMFTQKEKHALRRKQFVRQDPSSVKRDHNYFFGKSKVDKVTTQNFDEYIAYKDKAFIMFYNSCSPDTAWPAMELSTASRKKSSPNRGYAGVDCTSNQELCCRERASPLPIFKLYSRGNDLSTFTFAKHIDAEKIEELIDLAPVLPANSANIGGLQS